MLIKKLFNLLKKNKMPKFNCYYQESYTSSGRLFATVNSLEEAAQICDRDYAHGEYDHACINAIMERGYYAIGYSGSKIYVEEVS